jgi:hypothetical protein
MFWESGSNMFLVASPYSPSHVLDNYPFLTTTRFLVQISAMKEVGTSYIARNIFYSF